jgi:hypothetical protein
MVSWLSIVKFVDVPMQLQKKHVALHTARAKKQSMFNTVLSATNVPKFGESSLVSAAYL